MRDLKEIYNEVKVQCNKDNCQSVPNIAILSMEKAIEEYKMLVIEKLQNFSDNYEVGISPIPKHKLDDLIEALEIDNP